MPKYRKLHVKIVDSADVNDMPDDFTRLAWTWLPTKLDSEGRAYDDPQWLRSVLFPRRRDVTIEAVSEVLQWWEEHEMIVRYTVKDQNYFYVPSFKDYQSGTDKEAKSTIPAPCKKSTKSGATPELVKSRSGATPENSPSDSDSDSDANTFSAENPAPDFPPESPAPSVEQPKTSSTREIQKSFELACGYPVDWKAGNAVSAKWLSEHGYTADQVRECYAQLKAQDFWKNKPLSLPSLQKQIGEWAKANAPPVNADGIDWNNMAYTPSGKLVRVQ